jgi:hypothetical protein
MKIFKMDLNKAEEIALKYGFKPAPKDHPIYSEGVSIMFVNSSVFSKKKKNQQSSIKPVKPEKED